jgi:hypothetical protein
MTATTLCVLAAHAAPALAAEPASRGGPVNAGLSAKASNGYSATLKSEGDRLQLTLAREFASVLVYSFHGRVSTTGIRARVGDLGTIDLRFDPSGKTKRVAPPRHCSGPKATVTEGHFLGELHFRAERGVAAIDLSQATGYVATPGWRCHREGVASFLESAPSNFSYTVLQAKDSKRQLGFSALAGVDPEHPTATGAEFSASIETRRGSLTIDHAAATLAVNVFSFDTALSTATVTPPKPFRGSATYCRACAPGSQWSGDLSVSLPGIGAPVDLTGPAYEVSLKGYQGGGAAEGPIG